MATTLTSDTQMLELEPVPFIYRYSWREFFQVGLIGLIVGALAPLFSIPISRFIIEPLFCRNPDSFSFCAQGGTVAFGIALIVLSVAALLILASLGTYQPLINVIAPLAMLWGLDASLPTLAQDYQWHFYLITALLFAIAYALFYLLLRFRNFALSFFLVLLVVILVRWQL